MNAKNIKFHATQSQRWHEGYVKKVFKNTEKFKIVSSPCVGYYSMGQVYI